jgi:hypothetical protein
MKNILFILSLIVFSCKTVQTTAQTPQQSDTSSSTTTIINTFDSSAMTTTTPAQTAATDSVQQILRKLDNQKISDFSTFSAKAKVNSNALPVPVTANIRIQKDSIIWISFTATVLITTEVGRAKITRDSVWIMDKLHKTITRRSIAYLQTLFKTPFTFDDVQNIILGNPLLTQDSAISSSYANGEWNILLGNDTLKNLISVQSKDDSTLLLTHSYLQDSTDAENRSCDILYDGYTTTNNGKYFSQTRSITTTDNNAGQQANVQFISFDFDKPVDFPFNIPDNYSEK